MGFHARLFSFVSLVTLSACTAAAPITVEQRQPAPPAGANPSLTAEPVNVTPPVYPGEDQELKELNENARKWIDKSCEFKGNTLTCFGGDLADKASLSGKGYVFQTEAELTRALRACERRVLNDLQAANRSLPAPLTQVTWNLNSWAGMFYDVAFYNEKTPEIRASRFLGSEESQSSLFLEPTKKYAYEACGVQPNSLWLQPLDENAHYRVTSRLTNCDPTHGFGKDRIGVDIETQSVYNASLGCERESKYVAIEFKHVFVGGDPEANVELKLTQAKQAPLVIVGQASSASARKFLLEAASELFSKVGGLSLYGTDD